MTKANEFDKMNELLIERTAKKFERASKNKLKKFLTNEKFCDKINEGTEINIGNRCFGETESKYI